MDNFLVSYITSSYTTWILMRFWKEGLCTDISIYSESYQVSWCLSNRKDQILLKHYIEHLKKKIRTISLKWFISDDFDEFCNTCISVFNRHPQKNLCSWHVNHSWRNALKFISDKVQKSIPHSSHTTRFLLKKITTILTSFSTSLWTYWQ